MAEPAADSLEGWVAVRDTAFAPPQQPPPRLRFLVGWNAAEDAFAVTCHGRAEGEAPRSWAGLFSAPALLGVHRQLAALCPRLEPAFPALPRSAAATGLWALLFPGGAPVLDEAEAQELCRALERYLGWALELCGGGVLLDALFAAERPRDEEYFESLRELRGRALRGHLARAKEALRLVLQQHKSADTMVALMKVYEEEDEAYQDLVTMATQFYQYLLQPFRDMRELATLYKLEILKSLQYDNLGPKRVAALQKDAEEWTKRAENAVCSIQDITVNYFKETVKALTAMQKQMEQDQERFGKATWASALPRLENLKCMLAKETLQHLRARELCVKQKRAAIQKNMENLDEKEENTDSHNSCLNTAVLHVHIPLTAGPSRAAETQLWQDRAAARQRFRASGQQKAKHQPLLPAGTAAQPEMLTRCSGAGSWAKIRATAWVLSTPGTKGAFEDGRAASKLPEMHAWRRRSCKRKL